MSPFDLGFQLLLVLKHLRDLFDVNSRGMDAESRAVMHMGVYPHANSAASLSSFSLYPVPFSF
jgi:hypothetical protein